MTWALLPVALAAPTVAAYVWARHRKAAAAERGLKVTCSLLFLATFALGHPWPDGAYAAKVGVALAFGLVGDVALLGTSKRAFPIGLGAFLLGHIAYAAAFAPRWPAETGLAALAVTAAGAAALGGRTIYDAWPLLRSMRAPATIYVAFLATSTVLAVAPAAGGGGGPGRWVPAVGMALFLISDIAVARHRFVEADTYARLWGAPCYFAAQQLLALSAGFAPPS